MLYRFFVYGNILIASSAAFLCAGYAHFIGATHTILLGTCVFGATLFLYSLQRLLRLPELISTGVDRHRWIASNRSGVVLLAISGLILSSAIYFSYFYTLDSFLLLFLLGLLGVFYALNIGSFRFPLRDIPHLKIYLIGITWTSVCFIWPNHLSGQDLNWILLSGLFLFIFASTIPFDVRDLIYDKPYQRTIPQIIGAPLSIGLSLVLLGVSCFLLFWSMGDLFWQGITFTYLLQTFWIITSFRIKKECVFSVGIDGTLILLGGSLWFSA